MSRIGKAPVSIPTGVTATLDGQTLAVKGPKGENTVILPAQVAAKIDGDQIVFTPENDSRQARAFWGLARALAQNAVTGVVEGFEKTLEVVGVGFKVEPNGKGLKLGLGFSHPVVVDPIDGVTLAIDAENKMMIRVSGADRQKVGEQAARIRAIKKPEPYKGKGIKYSGEFIARKAGKSAAK